MIALTLATCIAYADMLSRNADSLDTRDTQIRLALYYEQCEADLEREQGAVQLYRCALESQQVGTAVDCRWHTYGSERLPFEPEAE